MFFWFNFDFHKSKGPILLRLKQGTVSFNGKRTEIVKILTVSLKINEPPLKRTEIVKNLTEFSFGR